MAGYLIRCGDKFVCVPVLGAPAFWMKSRLGAKKFATRADAERFIEKCKTITPHWAPDEVEIVESICERTAKGQAQLQGLVERLIIEEGVDVVVSSISRFLLENGVDVVVATLVARELRNAWSRGT